MFIEPITRQFLVAVIRKSPHYPKHCLSSLVDSLVALGMYAEATEDDIEIVDQALDSAEEQFGSVQGGEVSERPNS